MEEQERTITVNGIRLTQEDIAQISPELAEDFSRQKPHFEDKLRIFCLKRNQENLHPKIDPAFENWYKSWVEECKNFERELGVDSSTVSFSKFCKGYGHSYSGLRRVLRSLSEKPTKDKSSFYLERYGMSLDEVLYAEFCLAEKYDIGPDEMLYAGIINKELDPKNPYPNMELLGRIKTSFLRHPIVNGHSVKHMFDKIGERKELLPLAGEMFEKVAKGAVVSYNVHGVLDCNLEVAFSKYLIYKDLMAKAGTPVEDSDAFKHPVVQQYLEKCMLDPEVVLSHMKTQETPIVRGHFIDVDETLIQEGQLNHPLYESMLKAREAGEEIYIFSGADKEQQKQRLKQLGVDIVQFPVIEKQVLKDCFVSGTIVDDTDPYDQGIIPYGSDFRESQEKWQYPHTGRDTYEFKAGKTPEGAKVISVKELLSPQHDTMSFIAQSKGKQL